MKTWPDLKCIRLPEFGVGYESPSLMMLYVPSLMNGIGPSLSNGH